jgi:crotonobetainyl-CoA:carnitine CoA-transferase CaiB-like acyl-CoA transferase
MKIPATGVEMLTVWPCKDGNITMMIAGGAIFGAGVRALVAWMTSEAAASQWLQEVDWDELDMMTITQETYDAVAAEVVPFLLSRTVGELYDRAVTDRILLAPVSTAELALQSPQLEAREAFVKIDHPELGGTLTYPGAFVKMSAWSPRIFRRAPHVGEHNVEVYCDELGLSRLDLAALKQAGVV